MNKHRSADYQQGFRDGLADALISQVVEEDLLESLYDDKGLRVLMRPDQVRRIEKFLQHRKELL